MTTLGKSATGCIKIPIKILQDDRGRFCELYRESVLPELPKFVQDNVSYSYAGVVRGMHFQTNNPQGKLVRVLTGIAVDVVVDLRVGSLTFGQVEQFLLLPHDYAVYVPPGFAHGFWVQKDAFFHYKCTTEYDPGSDGGINPINSCMPYPWREKDVIISQKDKLLPLFQDFNSPFKMES